MVFYPKVQQNKRINGVKNLLVLLMLLCRRERKCRKMSVREKMQAVQQFLANVSVTAITLTQVILLSRREMFGFSKILAQRHCALSLTLKFNFFYKKKTQRRDWLSAQIGPVSGLRVCFFTKRVRILVKVFRDFNAFYISRLHYLQSLNFKTSMSSVIYISKLQCLQSLHFKTAMSSVFIFYKTSMSSIFTLYKTSMSSVFMLYQTSMSSVFMFCKTSMSSILRFTILQCLLFLCFTSLQKIKLICWANWLNVFTK